MAEIHIMPPDTKDREKILLGIFDSRQLAWMIFGIVLYAISIFFNYYVIKMGAVCFIIGLPFIFAGIYIAVKKINGIPLWEYVVIKHKFKKTVKRYINPGGEDEIKFSIPGKGADI